MNQSTYIAAALLGGFILYLAAKGRFSAYTAVLWGPTSAALPSLSGSSNSGTSSILGSSPSLSSNGGVLGAIGKSVVAGAVGGILP